MLPQNVRDKAKMLGDEPAWNARDARLIVLALALDGNAVVKVEFWREHQGQSEWVSTSDYLPATYDGQPMAKAYWCAIKAGEFIQAHRQKASALFKLTWVTRLSLHSCVRLLTDIYQP